MGCIVEVAAALGLALSALSAFTVTALAGPLHLEVAHLREAPTSSASSSVTDRFSPSGVSQLRWRSRPVTMTRSPLPRESAWCWLAASDLVGALVRGRSERGVEPVDVCPAWAWRVVGWRCAVGNPCSAVVDVGAYTLTLR